MGRLPILLLALAGCGPSTPAVTSAPVGCGKDTDCKGARICMAQRCVDPIVDDESPAPAPSTTTTRDGVVASPSPVPHPTAAPPGPEPVTPQPMPTDAASGERPPPGCGCARDDLMCSMKCAQKGNAVGPGTSDASCDCPPGDLMCSMRCR
ncbi:MAG: hypothetical protein RIF41_21820 [Polyangiaceae bacterium]